MKNSFNLKIKYLFSALILLPFSMVSQQLSAEQKSVTLDHIKSSSTINIGYRQLEPFSFRDSDGKVTGYTIELCNMIADQLRVSLGIKKLAIHYIPILFTERVSALNSSKIDLDCSVNTVAPERQNSVSFSVDYFVANMRIISLRTNNIKSLNDLKGRAIAVPRGSKDLLELNRINREKNLSLSIVTSDTVEDAFDMMMQKRTAALILDDILAYPYINQSEHPEDFTVSSEVVGDKMKYALMMRKEDPLFVAFVDKTLGQIFESPLNAQLTSKWLAQKVVMKNTQNTQY
ncbi:amino acid ABC transporter substrate-binding protein [Buttiauxella sp. A2-C1_F]|uniref:amino acid ABC transporter substrate-binding protein n=1 Tax=Buttiauxella sp. A2-C1_F TaxID=2904526 RepID=UPI001E2BF891|nr:amino acid ABC transporter substrate-binding protein [Buttiauxella sp. A2-C1_F]MCE0847201.1 amino acid ABC transporter substrate-binding protein [Buttiauxella sp. A2-C1_F]